MNDRDSLWPIGVLVAFFLATNVLWLLVHHTGDPATVSMLALGCIWPLLALGFLLISSYIKMRRTSTVDPEDRGSGLTARGYFSIVVGPPVLEGLYLIGAPLENAATEWGAPILLLYVARALVLLAILYALLFELPFAGRDDSETYTARVTPTIAIGSLIVFLGSEAQYGFLAWMVSNPLYQISLAIRIFTFITVGAFILAFAIDVVRRAVADGLGLAQRWAALRARIAASAPGGFGAQLQRGIRNRRFLLLEHRSDPDSPRHPAWQESR